MHLILLVFMVMLQPKLSLKPTTAFEPPSIGLFAISSLSSAFLCCLNTIPGFKREEREAAERSLG